MTIKQKRAIYYAVRDRRLEKIKAAGLWNEYQAFRGGSRYHKLSGFEKKWGEAFK